jgi:hypothetical protein
MTKKGFTQVASLRQYLPENIPTVICGTGRRHFHTAEALGLKPTRYTGTAGVPEARNRAVNTIVFADGTELPYKLYTGPKDRAQSFIDLVNALPDRSVVITSRGSIKLFDKIPLEGKKATVYAYNPETQIMAELGSAASDAETDEI